MLAAAGILIAIGIAVGAGLFGKDGLLTTNDNGYFANVFTDVMSVLVTVFVIDRLNRRRDEQNAERELKEQLVRDASSISNETAKNAIHQLKKRKWMEGENGVLKGMDLDFANLQGTRLIHANLQNTRLVGTNLSDANLFGANMQDADCFGVNLQHSHLYGTRLLKANLNGAILQNGELKYANLQGANLRGANLQDADLELANMQGANLSETHLEGAYLRNANLAEANLDHVHMNSATILPDGTNWSQRTEMAYFTDSDHHPFWRSDDQTSPAFRGKDTPSEEE